MSHEHCKVWQMVGDEIKIVCPHCRKAFHQFPAADGDQGRAEESQRAHAENCPGIPLCARKKRRYDDDE